MKSFRPLRVVCSLALGYFTVAASAQTTQSVDPQTLIQNLSADDWRTRDSAQKALVELGDDAVPALSATTQQSDNAEARSRADSALAEIDEARAIGPSRITLHLHDVSPQEAFAAVAQQARATLEPLTPLLWNEVAPAPVSIDVDRVTFWSAVQTLGDASHIWPQQWGTSLRLANGGPLNSGPRCPAGPLLVIANSIERHQAVTFGSNVRRDQVLFHVLVMAEPKLRVVSAPMMMQLTEVTDDRGNSLLPSGPGSRDFGASADSAWWNCHAELSLPQVNAGARIRSLSGLIDVKVASQTQSVTFKLPPDPAGATATSTAGWLTLRDAAELPDHRLQYTLDCGGAVSGQSDYAWPQQLSHPNSLVLYDRQGRAFKRDASEFTGNGRNFKLILRFSRLPADNGGAVGEPDHLGGNFVVASRALSVPFSFEDLPLP